MRKTAIATLASFTLMSTFGFQTAMASTTTYYNSSIDLWGMSVSTPKHIVAMDGGHETSFVPIWYVEKALQDDGIGATWNGSTGTLTFTLSNGMTANVNNLPTKQTVCANTMEMVIDGNVVEYGPRITAKDPSDGVETTFVPIWYVEQALTRMGIQTTWNGASLKLAPSTYYNQRFGFSVDIPQTYLGTSLPADGDGLSWYSPDKTGYVKVYGVANGNDTVQNLLSNSLKATSTYKPTYHASGSDWFVVSGTETNAQGTSEIFYNKEFVGATSEYVLNITYPTADATKYQSVVDSVSQSFRPGSLK